MGLQTSVDQDRAILIADMNLLTRAANSAADRYGNLLGHFLFAPPILAAQVKADLVKCYQADTGEYPGSIVVLKTDRTVWQITGNYKLAASWKPYAYVHVVDTVGDTNALAASYGDLAYVLADDSLWLFTNALGFFGSDGWIPYRNNNPGDASPLQGGVTGIRGEWHRLWFLLMHSTRMARYNTNTTLTSYAPTPPNNVRRFTFNSEFWNLSREVFGNGLRIREVWNGNNPPPLTAWVDRHRDVLFAFEPAAYPGLKIKTFLNVFPLRAPSGEGFLAWREAFFPGIFMRASEGVHVRISNPGGFAGTLTGTINFSVQSQTTGGLPNPVIHGPFITATSNNVTFDPSEIIYTRSIVYTIGPAAFTSGALDYTWSGLGDPDFSSIDFAFTLAIETNGANQPIDGIDYSAPLATIKPLGLVDSAAGLDSVKGQVFTAGFGGAADWQDCSELAIGWETTQTAPQGVFLTVPAPLAHAEAGATGTNDSPENVFALPSFPILADSRTISPPYPGVTYRPPRWPVRRDTDPAFAWEGAHHNSDRFKFCLIRKLYVGRGPDPADAKHRWPKVAERPQLDVTVGYLRAGAFVKLALVTIPAGEVDAPLLYPEPGWPIFTQDPLVYKCSQYVNVQAAFYFPDPPIVQFTGYFSLAGGVTMQTPMTAMQYIDLAWLCDQLSTP